MPYGPKGLWRRAEIGCAVQPVSAAEIQPPPCPKCRGPRAFVAFARVGFVGTFCPMHGQMGLAEHELPDAWPCPTCGWPMSLDKRPGDGTYIYRCQHGHIERLTDLIRASA